MTESTEKHFKPGDKVIVRKVDLPPEERHMPWPLGDRDSAVGDFDCTTVLSNFGFGPVKGNRQRYHTVFISNGVDWEPINFWDEEVELFEPEKFDTEGVTAAKNIAFDALEGFADEKMNTEMSGWDGIELAERVIEDLKAAGVEFPDSTIDPHGVNRKASQ